MFNPAPQRVAPQTWSPDTVLQPVRPGDTGFANTDWGNVPRVDYRTERFRQLAVPDPARVVDDASEFEPWQPRRLDEPSTSGDASDDHATHVDAGAPEPRDAFADADGHTSQDAANVHDDSTEGALKQSSDESHPSPDLSARADASAPDGNGERTQNLDEVQADAAIHQDVTQPDSTDASSETHPQASDANHQASGVEGESGDEGFTPGNAEPTLDSAAVQEACDAARREGQEQGREEGLAQGREQALEESRHEREAALAQAEADKAQALQQLREELEGEIAPLKRQLNQAAEQVQSLMGQPDKLYEHVKRLSLHLAEQIVLGELNVSSAAIERLIQRCLDELDLHGNHVVTVELNPQDKARLQERAGEMSHALSVQAVPSLQPGSVRVMVHDTLVEDLVGNRLEALARSLLVQPEVWREQSPFFRQPLAQRDTEVQDAPVRAVPPRESVSAVASATAAVMSTGKSSETEPLDRDPAPESSPIAERANESLVDHSDSPTEHSADSEVVSPMVTEVSSEQSSDPASASPELQHPPEERHD